MQHSVVMTLIGADRPGLVETVASTVAEHGGNWLESRMARLGGHFAGIVHVSVPAEKERVLIEQLRNLDASGLQVTIYRDHGAPPPETARLALLEIVGQDRPGIVRQISGALAAAGVNVEDLHTECVSAAMSGESLFKARARLRIPDSCAVDELRAQLEKIASDLIIEVSLQPVEG
jgi:glycine cleavage system regulatory protein